MNRAERMLFVLRDGKPHTRQDIQHRAGYFLTNNAASELRRAGHAVRQWRERGFYWYQLEASPLSQSDGADIREDHVAHHDVPRSSQAARFAGPSSDYESGAAPAAACRPSEFSPSSWLGCDGSAQLTMEVA